VLLALTVEIEATDPLRGRLRTDDGVREPFVGWLGLARLLGEMVDRASVSAQADDPLAPEDASPSEGR
jgi:hypothetical protein